MTEGLSGLSAGSEPTLSRLGRKGDADTGLHAAPVTADASLWQQVKRHRHFYLFISPFFILFGVLGLYPLLFSLYLSFVRWNGLQPKLWVGLENFRLLFTDGLFWSSIWTTLLLGVMYIPPMFALALVLALVLNDGALRLKGWFRAAVFVPCITPMVVIAIVFSLLFGTQFGVLNWLWTSLGGLLRLEAQKIPWLETPWGARVAVCVLLVWRWTGYNMVLMLAGLQGINPDIYEAATLDGASRWQRLWHVTLPLLRPTLTFCTIMSLVGTAFMFDEVFVLTRGGPGVATTNFGLYLFQQSFQSFRFGYASAAAYVVAAAVFMLSLIVLRLGRAAD